MNIHFVNNSLAMEYDACHFLAMDACQFLAMDDLSRPPEPLITEPGRPLRGAIRPTDARSVKSFSLGWCRFPAPMFVLTVKS